MASGNPELSVAQSPSRKESRQSSAKITHSRLVGESF